MKLKICDMCNKSIKDSENYYISDSSLFCQKCGEQVLVFKEYGYIHTDQDNGLEYILDDELSDIEIYKYVFAHDLEK